MLLFNNCKISDSLRTNNIFNRDKEYNILLTDIRKARRLNKLIINCMSKSIIIKNLLQYEKKNHAGTSERPEIEGG